MSPARPFIGEESKQTLMSTSFDDNVEDNLNSNLLVENSNYPIQVIRKTPKSPRVNPQLPSHMTVIRTTTSALRLTSPRACRPNGASRSSLTFFATPSVPWDQLQCDKSMSIRNGKKTMIMDTVSSVSGRHYSSDNGNKRKSVSNPKQSPRRQKSSRNEECDKNKSGGSGGGGGNGNDNGREGKSGGLFVDQNERMQRIFDKLKERLPSDMKQHFEPGSVNYHICKTLVLLMDENYLKLLPRAIEEFDRAIELAQQHRQFSFIDTVGQSFLRDQITMQGGRRGYELVLSLLTGLLHERKEPHDAIRMYNSILDMEGVIAETYYCRGICNMRGLGDYHKAKQDLQMAIRIRDDFYQAYDQLGVLLGTMYMVHGSPQAQKSNRESALRLFDRAIEINEQYAPAYTNRAVVLMDQDPHRALRDLETSLSLDELSAYTHQQLGTMYMNHFNKLDKALDCFNRALQLQPHNPSLYQFRAILYQKMKLMKEVDRDLRTAQDVYQDLQRDVTVSKHY